MDERRRRRVYPKVKAASGAYGALRKEAESRVAAGRSEAAAALLEMMLVRELDDWYVGETLPNLRKAIARFAGALIEGNPPLHPDIERAGGLLAALYAGANYDTSYSHDLCKTVVEKKPSLLRSDEDRSDVKATVAVWDEFRDTEPLADVLSGASRKELNDLGSALRLDLNDLPTSLDGMREKLESELMYAGADSLASAVRGRGVPYAEIARDVATRQGLSANRYEDSAAAVHERRLLHKLLADAWDGMTEDQRRQFVDEAQKAGVGGLDPKLTGSVLTFALLGAGRAAGFATYQLAVVVANAVAKQLLGRGLTLAANAALTRAVSLVLGPVGLAVNLAAMVPSVTGPAFRKTIPAALVVGLIRLRCRAGIEPAEKL